MPFESEAQRRWMWANHPEMARRWQEHTPQDAKLPARKAGALPPPQAPPQGTAPGWNPQLSPVFKTLRGAPAATGNPPAAKVAAPVAPTLGGTRLGQFGAPSGPARPQQMSQLTAQASQLAPGGKPTAPTMIGSQPQLAGIGPKPAMGGGVGGGSDRLGGLTGVTKNPLGESGLQRSGLSMPLKAGAATGPHHMEAAGRKIKVQRGPSVRANHRFSGYGRGKASAQADLAGPMAGTPGDDAATNPIDGPAIAEAVGRVRPPVPAQAGGRSLDPTKGTEKMADDVAPPDANRVDPEFLARALPAAIGAGGLALGLGGVVGGGLGGALQAPGGHRLEGGYRGASHTGHALGGAGVGGVLGGVVGHEMGGTPGLIAGGLGGAALGGLIGHNAWDWVTPQPTWERGQHPPQPEGQDKEAAPYIRDPFAKPMPWQRVIRSLTRQYAYLSKGHGKDRHPGSEPDEPTYTEAECHDLCDQDSDDRGSSKEAGAGDAFKALLNAVSTGGRALRAAGGRVERLGNTGTGLTQALQSWGHRQQGLHGYFDALAEGPMSIAARPGLVHRGMFGLGRAAEKVAPAAATASGAVATAGSFGRHTGALLEKHPLGGGLMGLSTEYMLGGPVTRTALAVPRLAYDYGARPLARGFFGQRPDPELAQMPEPVAPSMPSAASAPATPNPLRGAFKASSIGALTMGASAIGQATFGGLRGAAHAAPILGFAPPPKPPAPAAAAPRRPQQPVFPHPPMTPPPAPGAAPAAPASPTAPRLGDC